MVEKIPMKDVIVKANRSEASKYWFSPDTMKFFNTDFGGHAWKKGNEVYFITSERRSGSGKRRRYSIRKMDWKTGRIGTFGEFQEFSTEKQAMRRMNEVLSKSRSKKQLERMM